MHHFFELVNEKLLWQMDFTSRQLIAYVEIQKAEITFLILFTIGYVFLLN